jgi:hypothetical protein
MIKSPLARILLCLAVLALIGVTALALRTKQDIITTNDGRMVIATKGPSIVTLRDIKSDAGLKTIAGNLSDYQYATYFCCYGFTVAQGPPSFLFTSWVAVAFTPTANATVTRVEVPVTYISSADTEFRVSITDDSNNVPGKAIKIWQVKTTNPIGSCCILDVENDSAGIQVAAGTQYWVTATSSSKHDFFGSWMVNSTDMRPHLLAGYCKGSSTYCGTTNNGKWVSGDNLMPAFAVLGH